MIKSSHCSFFRPGRVAVQRRASVRARGSLRRVTIPFDHCATRLNSNGVQSRRGVRILPYNAIFRVRAEKLSTSCHILGSTYTPLPRMRRIIPSSKQVRPCQYDCVVVHVHFYHGEGGGWLRQLPQYVAAQGEGPTLRPESKLCMFHSVAHGTRLRRWTIRKSRVASSGSCIICPNGTQASQANRMINPATIRRNSGACHLNHHNTHGRSLTRGSSKASACGTGHARSCTRAGSPPLASRQLSPPSSSTISFYLYM